MNTLHIRYFGKYVTEDFFKKIVHLARNLFRTLREHCMLFSNNTICSVLRPLLTPLSVDLIIGNKHESLLGGHALISISFVTNITNGFLAWLDSRGGRQAACWRISQNPISIIREHMPWFKNILAEGQVNDVDMMTRHLAATDWFMTGPGLINGIEGQILQIRQTEASPLGAPKRELKSNERASSRASRPLLSQNARNCFLYGTNSSSIKRLASCSPRLGAEEVST